MIKNIQRVIIGLICLSIIYIAIVNLLCLSLQKDIEGISLGDPITGFPELSEMQSASAKNIEDYVELSNIYGDIETFEAPKGLTIDSLGIGLNDKSIALGPYTLKMSKLPLSSTALKTIFKGADIYVYSYIPLSFKVELKGFFPTQESVFGTFKSGDVLSIKYNFLKRCFQFER